MTIDTAKAMTPPRMYKKKPDSSKGAIRSNTQSISVPIPHRHKNQTGAQIIKAKMYFSVNIGNIIILFVWARFCPGVAFLKTCFEKSIKFLVRDDGRYLSFNSAGNFVWMERDNQSLSY